VKEKYVKKFKNKKVNIGVPHWHIEDRLFYRTGIIKTIDTKFITLENDHSIKKIPLQDIREIELCKEEN